VNRYLFKAGAVAGVASLAVLAAGPAMAADQVSQATAQSADVSVAGSTAASQQFTASNDGKKETTNNASTLPTVLSGLPGNSLLGLGAAPQTAGANADGTSYACAGVTGTGGGIVKVGNTGCNITGQPATLDLGSMNLGNALLGQDSALGSALGNIPGISTLLTNLGLTVNGVATQLSNALKATPLGQVTLGGSLSAIQGICTADPDRAAGAANIVDSSGGSKDTPIGVTIPTGAGGTQTITLLNLPANPKPNTPLLTNLDSVTQTLTVALTQELDTALLGALKGINPALTTLQSSLIKPLVAALQPVLKPLEANVLDVTLNKQVSSDSGKKIDVTALDGNILPLGGALPGGNGLISLKLGHVTCGPNARVAAPPSQSPSPTPTANPTTPGGNVPTNVDSGLAGDSSHANEIIAGVAALLALTGVGGAAAYRRFGMPRG
jgi:hypothetical protein